MNRRDIMKGSVGAALLGSSTLAEAAPEPSTLSQAGLADELDRLERDLDVLETGDDLGLDRDLEGVVRLENPEHPQTRQAHERMLRSTMRTLAIMDTVSSLPAANRRDPAVMEMLARHGGEMQYALGAQLAQINTLGVQERREIQQALQDDPQVALELAERLDSIAHLGALPSKRRRRLKRMVKRLTWKLQRQPVDEVLSEALTGHERMIEQVRAQGVADDLEAMVEQHAELRRWREQETTWNDVLGTGEQPPTPDEEAAKKRIKSAKSVLFVSGINLGVAAVSTLIAVLTYDSGVVAVAVTAALITGTAFVVLLIIGLILLGIGLAKLSRARHR